MDNKDKKAIYDICLQYLTQNNKEEIEHFNSVYDIIHINITEASLRSKQSSQNSNSDELAFIAENLSSVLVTLITVITYNFIVGFSKALIKSRIESRVDNFLNDIERKLIAKGLPKKTVRDLKIFTRDYILSLGQNDDI